MEDKPEFVQVKVDAPKTKDYKPQKAMQFRVDQNKTVVIYNRINNYILDAFLKAVFTHDDARSFSDQPNLLATGKTDLR